MGGHQSRLAPDVPPVESDDEVMRVVVRPSHQLLARLEEHARSQTTPWSNTNSTTEDALSNEAQRKQEEDHMTARRQQVCPSSGCFCYLLGVWMCYLF